MSNRQMRLAVHSAKFGKRLTARDGRFMGVSPHSILQPHLHEPGVHVVPNDCLPHTPEETLHRLSFVIGRRAISSFLEAKGGVST